MGYALENICDLHLEKKLTGFEKKPTGFPEEIVASSCLGCLELSADKYHVRRKQTVGDIEIYSHKLKATYPLPRFRSD